MPAHEEKGFSKQGCKQHLEVCGLKRRWCLSAHCLVESDSLSLVLAIAGVLYKRDSKNNLITWFVVLVMDDRTISSALVMAILLNLALFLLWCFRIGPWDYLALFKIEPCIQHCETLWQKGAHISYTVWSVIYLFCSRDTLEQAQEAGSPMLEVSSEKILRRCWRLPASLNILFV